MSTEVLRMALQVLFRNPGRTILTVLGLAIGVGAFIAVISFGQSARQSVLAQFEALGTNVLRIRTRIGRDAGTRAPKPLSDADIRTIRREATSVLDLIPVVFKGMDVSHEGVSHRTSVHGSTEAFTLFRSYSLAAGGMFDGADLSQRAKVCVLGATVARELFGEADPLGRRVTVAGQLPCRVVGILQAKGQSMSGRDSDDLLILPVTTYASYLGLPDGYTNLEVRPASRSLLAVAKTEIEELLRRTHGLSKSDPADFEITSPDEVTQAADQTAKILTGLLAGIAAVSLLVGGIGIMNILLVSVAERTHEIGIRAAIGASPRQILTQFLAEAMALAAVGTAAGVVLGVAASLAVAGPMGWPATISPAVVLGSAAFGIAVGLTFGYVPARRAALLDPIDALRRE